MAKKAAYAFQMQDNTVSYLYSASMRDLYTTKTYDESKAQNIVKNGYNFNHTDVGSKFGDNVFQAEFLASSRAGAASGADYHAANGSGALDAYYIIVLTSRSIGSSTQGGSSLVRSRICTRGLASIGAAKTTKARI